MRVLFLATKPDVLVPSLFELVGIDSRLEKVTSREMPAGGWSYAYPQ
ncbi:hypothetical protein HYG81_19580 (plasmid) [Natrinema zhouii]|nr:hypothetical protein [Natrinema zhouii]UHQ98277.1 hypothetical protein HYG81_19580 [Natrinema zhouii]